MITVTIYSIALLRLDVGFWDTLVIYYEQINNCEVTDGPLADHSGTVVIADLGCWLDYPPQNKLNGKYYEYR